MKRIRRNRRLAEAKLRSGQTQNVQPPYQQVPQNQPIGAQQMNPGYNQNLLQNNSDLNEPIQPGIPVNNTNNVAGYPVSVGQGIRAENQPLLPVEENPNQNNMPSYPAYPVTKGKEC